MRQDLRQEWKEDTRLTARRPIISLSKMNRLGLRLVKDRRPGLTTMDLVLGRRGEILTILPKCLKIESLPVVAVKSHCHCQIRINSADLKSKGTAEIPTAPSFIYC